MNGSDSKSNIKSMHAKTNITSDSKHNLSLFGSKKTKATSSTNDSQNVLPNIQKKSRNKVMAISKDNSSLLSKRSKVGRNKSRVINDSSGATPEINNSKLNTLSREVDEYDNEFDSEEDRAASVNCSAAKNNESKLSIRNKNHSPRLLSENDGKVILNSKTPNEDRKVSPYIRKSELPQNDDEKKTSTPNYINLSNHIQEKE